MSCTPPSVIIDGVSVSTNDFINFKELMKVSDDTADPTHDGYDESIANGNNTNNRRGIQFPASTQTTPPGPITIPPAEAIIQPPPGGNGVPVGCLVWTGDYNLQLSPNFKVKDFTLTTLSVQELTAFSPLTAQDRCCNLQALAVNVAEPLRARFGSFRINSGLRNSNTTPGGLSQHVSGQAMDVQFPGWNYNQYWENAAWVRDNIQYDQFIFEHSSKTGLAWYHLSFNRNGNRAAGVRTKVMTMFRNNYDSGLKRYG